MKTSTLIAALALSFVASGAALAQEATYELPQPLTSQVTRAQVVAELMRARADGSLHVGEGEALKPAVFVAQRSRDEVKAETLAAIASGELAYLNREDNGYTPAARRAVGTPVQIAQAAR